MYRLEHRVLTATEGLVMRSRLMVAYFESGWFGWLEQVVSFNPTLVVLHQENSGSPFFTYFTQNSNKGIKVLFGNKIWISTGHEFCLHKILGSPGGMLCSAGCALTNHPGHTAWSGIY